MTQKDNAVEVFMHKSIKSPKKTLMTSIAAVWDMTWYGFWLLLFCGILESVLKITESLKVISLKLKLNSCGHVYLPKAWLTT